MKKNIAIILAAGSGNRTLLNYPKQFYKIAGKTLLEHTLTVFEKNINIDSIIVVSSRDFYTKTKEILDKSTFLKIGQVILGGKTRQESVFSAISAVQEKDVNLIIHDVARPFLKQEILDACIESLKQYNALGIAIESSDTLIEVENHLIKKIPNRKTLKRIQTPQCFDIDIIRQAHQKAKQENNYTFTDDCSMVLQYTKEPVFIIPGDVLNIKITTSLDLIIAEKIFELDK